MANYDENDPNLQSKIEEIWKESLEQYVESGDPKHLSEHWQHSSDMEEMQYRNFTDVYKFQENNPYSSLSNPLEGIKQVIESGNTRVLTQVLEAHLQKNPKDADGWRVLGMIFQDRDQDQKGVTCLLQAIKANPTDKDSLLQLGVSCLNIFDEIHAMNFIGNLII